MLNYKRCKNDYFQNKIINYNNNIKHVWKTISEIVNTKHKEKITPSQININNEIIEIKYDPLVFANTSNNHFLNVEIQIAFN